MHSILCIQEQSSRSEGSIKCYSSTEHEQLAMTKAIAELFRDRELLVWEGVEKGKMSKDIRRYVYKSPRKREG